jgi:hypothetical protein
MKDKGWIVVLSNHPEELNYDVSRDIWEAKIRQKSHFVSLNYYVHYSDANHSKASENAGSSNRV